MKFLKLHLALIIVAFSFNNAFSQGDFKQQKFISSTDTIIYYRPTESYIEKLKEISAGTWYKLQFYITYLDKMQKAVSEGRSLKNISGPTPEKNMRDGIWDIQNSSKKNKKVYKLITAINPQWFEDEYNAYVFAEKNKYDKSLKPASFISRNDSIEFKNLCDSLVHIGNAMLNYETCYYDNQNNVSVWNYRCENSGMALGFYKDFKGDKYRLKMIDGSFDELYIIWTKYFGGQKSKVDFNKMEQSMPTPYEDAKISIKDKESITGTFFKVGKSWRIKL